MLLGPCSARAVGVLPARRDRAAAARPGRPAAAAADGGRGGRHQLPDVREGAGRAQSALRNRAEQQPDRARSHPELKLSIPPWVFCVSWCPDFVFGGTQAERRPAGRAGPAGRAVRRAAGARRVKQKNALRSTRASAHPPRLFCLFFQVEGQLGRVDCIQARQQMRTASQYDGPNHPRLWRMFLITSTASRARRAVDFLLDGFGRQAPWLLGQPRAVNESSGGGMSPRNSKSGRQPMQTRPGRIS